MLRDVLTSLPQFGTWPCDEINYIWRHGNVRYPSDELPAELATPTVRRFVRSRFAAIQRSLRADVVVEKTCANCLRVPFVESVLDKPRYVNIERDGLDAAGSARLRWSAPIEIRYLLRKARYVPPSDLPYHFGRFVSNRWHQTLSGERRLAFWGPRLDDMEELLKEYTIEEVCAVQWRRCVEGVRRGLAMIPKERVFHVRYEEFVHAPVKELNRIVQFLGQECDARVLADATAGVSARSIGKGASTFGEEECRRVRALLGKERTAVADE